MNLGEGEYSESALQYFVEELPYTYVIQAYFKDASPAMKKRILTACEHNRRKLTVLANIYKITVPDQIYMLWPRLKTLNDSTATAPTPRTKKRKTTTAAGARSTDKRKRIDSEQDIQQPEVVQDKTDII